MLTFFLMPLYFSGGLIPTYLLVSKRSRGNWRMVLEKTTMRKGLETTGRIKARKLLSRCMMLVQ